MTTKLRLVRVAFGRALSRTGCCAAIALACVLSNAQIGLGDDPAKIKKEHALIAGTVWSADHHPVYGVRVIVRRADAKKGGYERTSDHNGEFAVRVPAEAADYIVRADVKMPKGEPQPEAKVHVESNERVEVGLHLK